ncbi:MAG: S-layer homology domain-containing protein [Bacillota bacterium]
MLRRIIFFFFPGLLWLVLAVPPAQGIEVINIKAFDHQSGQGAEYITSNVVELGILLNTKSDNVKEVKVGSQTARQALDSDYSWVIDKYVLKPGQNKITAAATDNSGKTHKKDTTVHYLDLAVPGARYYVENIYAAGRLKLFNNTLNVELPKNTYVIWKNAPAPDQSLTFELIRRPSVRPGPQHAYVSNVCKVAAYSNQFTLMNPGRLSLSYDPQISKLAAGNLTVFYSSSLSSSPHISLRTPLARNLGGVVDTGAKTITVPLAESGFGYYVVVHALGDFRDFEAGRAVNLQESRPYVLTLWAKGIMTPLAAYSNGRPVEPGFFGLTTADGKKETELTRGEMACMLIRGLNLETFNYPAWPAFSDLQGQQPLDIINIERSAELGLFSGFPAAGGTMHFRPRAGVTRQQAAVTLTRAANLTLPEQNQAATILARLCPYDHQEIEPWAKPYVAAAIQGGLIETASPGYFRPASSLTRAGGAKYIYLTLKMLKKI